MMSPRRGQPTARSTSSSSIFLRGFGENCGCELGLADYNRCSMVDVRTRTCNLDLGDSWCRESKNIDLINADISDCLMISPGVLAVHIPVLLAASRLHVFRYTTANRSWVTLRARGQRQCRAPQGGPCEPGAGRRIRRANFSELPST